MWHYIYLEVLYVHECDYTDWLWFITLLKAAFNMAINYALAKINKDNLHLKEFQEKVINTYIKRKDCF